MKSSEAVDVGVIARLTEAAAGLDEYGIERLVLDDPAVPTASCSYVIGEVCRAVESGVVTGRAHEVFNGRAAGVSR
jgi:hypothetical protein